MCGVSFWVCSIEHSRGLGPGAVGFKGKFNRGAACEEMLVLDWWSIHSFI